MKKENPTKANVVTTATRYFVGTDPLNPNHYSANPDLDKPCGFPQQTICKIETPVDALGNPMLDEDVYDPNSNETKTVSEFITDALSSLGSTPTTNAVVSDFRAN
ncbi:hypothetical protein [Sphingobacterium sp. xlx-130]|nr:hypothetical protein [Sphingobacterium sp. xlx-130]